MYTNTTRPSSKNENYSLSTEVLIDLAPFAFGHLKYILTKSDCKQSLYETLYLVHHQKEDMLAFNGMCIYGDLSEPRAKDVIIREIRDAAHMLNTRIYQDFAIQIRPMLSDDKKIILVVKNRQQLLPNIQTKLTRINQTVYI